MKKKNNFVNNFFSKNYNNKHVKSLFEVECFLNKISNLKNSLDLVNNVKHLSKRNNSHKHL